MSQDQEVTTQLTFNTQEAGNWTVGHHWITTLLLQNLAYQTKTPKADDKWSLLHFYLPNVEQVQWTLGQHGFELHGSTYMLIFFSINTTNIFSLSYDFLSNIFYSLAYFIVKNKGYNTCNIISNMG